MVLIEDGASPPIDSAASAWRRIRASLEAQSERVKIEIKEYPSPITGCDDQFNHLLDRRSALVRELGNLPDGAGGADGVRRFLERSTCVDEATARDVRSWLDAGG